MSKTQNDRTLSNDTRGLATIEYILVACLVSLVTLGAAEALGVSISPQVDRATDAIARLPSDSDAPMAFGTSMGSGAAEGLGAAGGGCASHVASGGGAGAPCDPATFGSCVGGGSSTIVVSCNPSSRLTVARAP